MDHLPTDILDRIQAAYYQLTTAERRVADFVLMHHGQVQLTTVCGITSLAGHLDSPSLGFGGEVDAQAAAVGQKIDGEVGVEDAVKIFDGTTDKPEEDIILARGQSFHNSLSFLFGIGSL